MNNNLNNHSNPCLRIIIEKADKDQLLSLLKKAHISVGHANGRLISVSQYNGSVTLSLVKNCIENLYEAALKPMRAKQRQCRPLQYYPKISGLEEYEIGLILIWREEIDDVLYDLLDKGKRKIDRLATKSCYGNNQIMG